MGLNGCGAAGWRGSLNLSCQSHISCIVANQSGNPSGSGNPKQAVLIVNARSRRGRKLFRKAVEGLRRRGIEVISGHAVRNPALLQPTVKRAVAAGAPMIIVGGGDGSLSSSVDYLVGHDCVFGLLPLGTANSFARTMGIPLDLEGALDVIAFGTPRRIDLGMIDDDYYANCAAIGLSPLIAETVPHWLKSWFGKIGYATWAVFSLWRFRPFTLTVNGETIEAVEVRIANGGYHGGTELVDDACVQSGEIVVQAVIGKTRRWLLWSWLASFLRIEARKATTREFHGTQLSIATEPPLPISIDGEIAAQTPVMAHVAAGVISVAAPRNSGTS